MGGIEPPVSASRTQRVANTLHPDDSILPLLTYNNLMAGILYVVATPIGNLEDITLRAIRILKEVDAILAEDTRVTQKLLSYYEIVRPILSYHQHSDDTRKFEILKRLLDGDNLALVTDAGTPGISDPGNELIDFLLTAEPSIRIVPVPGASAVTTALSASGFRTDRFIFLGFLPKKGKAKLFSWLKASKLTFAFYESPHRLVKSLERLMEDFGENRVYVARELTKLHETHYRGNITEVLKTLSNASLKGEVVVVIES